MKITSKQYALSLYELVFGKNETEASSLLKAFVNLIIENRDYNKVDEIMAEFSRIWDDRNSELAVSLTSARKLESDSKNIIAEYLKNKTGFNEINFSEKIDDKILGGMVLRYHDKILDGSLKNNLNNLKEKIII